MPGRFWESRSSRTSGVISPRSSAINGKAPSSLFAATKKSDPGPGAHCPFRALDAPIGTCQAAAEGAEMIEPDNVYVRQQRSQAIDVPSDNRCGEAHPSRKQDYPIAVRPR